MSWHSTDACPSDWEACLIRLGGRFFHSPPSLRFGAPGGEPVFALLHQGDRAVGLATGVWRRCRLSPAPRHFYSPTLPAVEDASLRPAALLAWKEHLRGAGAAEVTVDSYDSGWGDGIPCGTSARREYVVVLDLGAADIAARFSETHRRHLRRGQREGWTLRALAGEEALTTLNQVQGEAAQRAGLRGDELAPRPSALPLPRDAPAELHAFWGAETFAAWHDDMLLAAVLVGWANHRAYYVLGGSTPEGYHRSAAVWLHWRIMSVLAEHGCEVYNLGGTAASAVQPDDPAHGLFRFKSGFGAETRLCRGAHWALRPSHLRAHRAVRWLSTVLSPSARS